MANHTPYPSEEARRRGIRIRLVVILSGLAGVAFALLLLPYLR